MVAGWAQVTIISGSLNPDSGNPETETGSLETEKRVHRMHGTLETGLQRILRSLVAPPRGAGGLPDSCPKPSARSNQHSEHLSLGPTSIPIPIPASPLLGKYGDWKILKLKHMKIVRSCFRQLDRLWNLNKLLSDDCSLHMGPGN